MGILVPESTVARIGVPPGLDSYSLYRKGAYVRSEDCLPSVQEGVRHSGQLAQPCTSGEDLVILGLPWAVMSCPRFLQIVLDERAEGSLVVGRACRLSA